MNTKFFGYYSLKISNTVQSRAIKEVLRVSDTINSNLEYAQEKCKDRYELFDMEAKNSFATKSILILMIKYIYGYTQYSLRDAIINT